MVGEGRMPHRGSQVVQQRGFEYRADGYLTALSDRLNGARRFHLDRVGRITQINGQGWTETYAYDAAGNLTQASWPRSHGQSATGTREFSGLRVMKAGRWTYIHDGAGRVVERRKTRISRKPDVWRYTWDAEDRLTECETPDGTVWTYNYDPLGRRTSKKRLDVDGQVVEETLFTWNGTQVIEQTTTGIGLRPIALTWEYEGLAPVAQAERVLAPDSQQGIDARFFAIITDLVGTPTELVTTDGDLAWRTRSTLWGTTAVARGATAHTPLRHPGQYADPETGLNYNLNRHYDPAVARYVSPDPLGLDGGKNPLAWVDNPYRWRDPLGLKCEDLKFEPSPKHGRDQRGNAAPEPTNPQESIEKSIVFNPNTTRRVAANPETGEFSVFDETHNGTGIYHGHTRSWDELSPQMQAALRKAGMVNKKGKIQPWEE